jgi:hypothetical protein
MVMSGHDLDTMAHGMESVQSAEGLVTVLVCESSWITGLLADVLDLLVVPSGVPCE